jgi:hypothetical protein
LLYQSARFDYMAILIDEKKRVLVQGITGWEGQARSRIFMIARTPGPRRACHRRTNAREADPSDRSVKHGYDGPAPQKVKE